MRNRELPPAGTAGGQRPAGIATEYIIYLPGLAGFFSLLIANLFLEDDQPRVSQTILPIAQAIHDEQGQDPQLNVNGIGTIVSKLETLSHYEQTESFNSDTRARSTAADLLCGVKYEGFLARQELQELCDIPVVICLNCDFI